MSNKTGYPAIIAAAAFASITFAAASNADSFRAGDRYLVDLALSGMPISLTHEQELAMQSQLPAFENFNTPGKVYLDALAVSGWQPEGGDSDAPAVADAFTTPSAGYLAALHASGWNAPGFGPAIDLTTPGERYLEMLTQAGWQPGGLDDTLDMMPTVAMR